MFGKRYAAQKHRNQQQTQQQDPFAVLQNGVGIVNLPRGKGLRSGHHELAPLLEKIHCVFLLPCSIVSIAQYLHLSSVGELSDVSIMFRVFIFASCIDLFVKGILNLVEQIIDIDRLHQVVKGPVFHAFPGHLQACMPGQHDHLGQGRLFFDRSQCFNAPHARHPDIQHHHVRRGLGQMHQRLFTAADTGGVHIAFTHPLEQRLQKVRFIVHKQDRHWFRHLISPV